MINFQELTQKRVSGVILAEKDEKMGYKMSRDQFHAYFEDLITGYLWKVSTFDRQNLDIKPYNK